MDGPSLLQALLCAEVSAWQRQIQATWTLERCSKFTMWIFALLRIQTADKEPNVKSDHIFLQKGQVSPSFAKIQLLKHLQFKEIVCPESLIIIRIIGYLPHFCNKSV